MKVILKSEVDHLGLAGDLVDVADGYGRNYLLPRGLAILATKGAMKEAEALIRSRKASEAKTLGAAEAAREALEARTLLIPARVDDRGSLYGSVSAHDVQRVLKERGHDIERKRIDLRGTIKEIGVYEIPVRVHPQVSATVQVEVVDEEGRVTREGVPDPEPVDETELLAQQALAAAAEYDAEEAESDDTVDAADTADAGDEDAATGDDVADAGTDEGPDRS
jgi:large subunit ribosomal protein L9